MERNVESTNKGFMEMLLLTRQRLCLNAETKKYRMKTKLHKAGDKYYFEVIFPHESRDDVKEFFWQYAFLPL